MAETQETSVLVQGMRNSHLPAVCCECPVLRECFQVPAHRVRISMENALVDENHDSSGNREIRLGIERSRMKIELLALTCFKGLAAARVLRMHAALSY